MNRNENEAESFAGNFMAFGEEALFFEVPRRRSGSCHAAVASRFGRSIRKVWLHNPRPHPVDLARRQNCLRPGATAAAARIHRHHARPRYRKLPGVIRERAGVRYSVRGARHARAAPGDGVDATYRPESSHDLVRPHERAQ